MPASDDFVLEILQEQGYVTPAQIALARGDAQSKGASTVSVLIDRGVITELDRTLALAEQFGMDTISLQDHDIAPELLSASRRRRPAVQGGAGLPPDETLTVALSDPLDVETLDSLRYVLKCNVEGVVAPRGGDRGGAQPLLRPHQRDRGVHAGGDHRGHASPCRRTASGT